MQNRKTVAIFDSGIGGLTLLKECYEKVQGVDFIYLADNSNMPYGNKTEEEIFESTKQSLQLLERYAIDALVLACNTVTAVSIEKLRADSSFAYHILGVEPAILPALKNQKTVEYPLLLLATEGTLKSGRMENLLNRYCTKGQVESYACKTLATEIERNILQLKRVNWAEFLPQGMFSGVILGCTHYIHIKNEIQMHYKVPVFDGNLGTINHLQKKLQIPQKIGDFQENTVKFIGKTAIFNQKVFENIMKINFGNG